jgi:hypothetical protein
MERDGDRDDRWAGTGTLVTLGLIPLLYEVLFGIKRIGPWNLRSPPRMEIAHESLRAAACCAFSEFVCTYVMRMSR